MAEISADTYLLLASVALGFGIGLWYEVFRVLRLALPSPAWLVGVEDLIFFLPLSPILIFFHYALCDGIFRWFSLCGTLFGFLLYLGTLGKVVSRFSRAFLRWIKRILCFFARLLLRPVAIVFKKITNCLFCRIRVFGIMMRRNYLIARRKRRKKRILAMAKKGFIN